jgi:hypothetical protein
MIDMTKKTMLNKALVIAAFVAFMSGRAHAFSPAAVAFGTLSTTTATRAAHSNRVLTAFSPTKHSISMNIVRLRMSEDDSGWEAPKSAMIGGAGVNNAGEPPFEIRGFSLGNLIIALGLLVTALSFAQYLGEDTEGLQVSGLGFVYGIPIFLAGAALKYAEIEPVPCFSTPSADAAYDKHATEIIKKVKQDVTRHRYGDEAHLDTTVKKLGLVVPGKSYPQLQELRQEATEDGQLVFTMVWQSLDTPYKMWADENRIKKYSAFFGTGVTADVVKVDAEQRMVGIKLTTVPKGDTVVKEPAEVSSAF